MELTVRIDGVEKRLEVTKQDGQYLFLIDGNEYRVDAEPLSNGAFAFFVDKRSYVAYLTKSGEGTRIAIGGRSFFVEGEGSNDNHRGGASASTHAGGLVESPMPGNIIAVNVSEGDAVEANQAVVVIESMKMQNEITSPVAGKVAKVHCTVGDQVNFGDVLVEITARE